MTDFNRRAFLGVAGLAAGAGVFGLDTSVLGVWAEQQAPSFPDEILNPIEVSGEEAVPIIGRLPGRAPHVRAASESRRASPRR